MDFDYMEKETMRLSYFSNTYLVVATLLIQLPHIFNWIGVEDIDGFISLNTLSFIFTGLMMSIIGSDIIKRKLYNKEEEVVNKIILLKVNRKAGRAFNFIQNEYSDNYLKKEFKNIRYYLSKFNFKTTSAYWNRIARIKGPFNWKTVIGILIQSIFVTTMSELYSQLNMGWYETLVSIITMILGGVFGFQAGKNLGFVYDVYPIRSINLLLDKYMKENDVPNREVNWQDRVGVQHYHLETDEIT